MVMNGQCTQVNLTEFISKKLNNIIIEEKPKEISETKRVLTLKFKFLTPCTFSSASSCIFLSRFIILENHRVYAFGIIDKVLDDKTPKIWFFSFEIFGIWEINFSYLTKKGA